MHYMQHILPQGSIEEVKMESRRLIDTFDSSTGGMLVGAGNGITEDNPLENIESFMDEVYNYGVKHRSSFK